MQESKKIVVLGHFGVGKTSLIRRFVTDSFSNNYKVTIGVHITKKMVEISSDTTITLILWDLEGTDEVNLIRDSYLMGTHGAIFVFDVSRPSTFQNIESDLKTIKAKMPNVPLILVGNKIDLVDSNEMTTLLKANQVDVAFLTSAKTGGEVQNLFLQIATDFVNDA